MAVEVTYIRRVKSLMKRGNQPIIVEKSAREAVNVGKMTRRRGADEEEARTQ